MLNEPHGTAETGGYATAGMVAAPVVGKLAARIGPLLGVIPDERRDLELSIYDQWVLARSKDKE